MRLKEMYVSLCEEEEFFLKYYSTAKENNGKIFSFFSTNLRGILERKRNEYRGFAQSFRVIKNVAGTPRKMWDNNTRARQEREKQHTVTMRKSEFFRVVNDSYELTWRGKVFERLLRDDTLSDLEKKILCYMLILPGYFDDTPNYLLEKTRSVFARFNQVGYSDNDVMMIIREFLSDVQRKDIKKADLPNYDYFILDCFHKEYKKDCDFLKYYYDASEDEKKELKKYISDNIKFKRNNSKDNKCAISYKLRDGGNCIPLTIKDNALLLFLSKRIIDSEFSDLNDFIDKIILTINEVSHCSCRNLKKFVLDSTENRSVFEVIYNQITNNSLPSVTLTSNARQEKVNNIDRTDMKGTMELERITNQLKQIAKVKSKYRCVLESCEMCQYFTAKGGNEPYLEIHHLIPREFANDFDVSIEVLENYVALCPNCHRKIHHAADKERRHMIKQLYTERKELLEKSGLPVTLDQLFSYYGINKKSFHFN